MKKLHVIFLNVQNKLQARFEINQNAKILNVSSTSFATSQVIVKIKHIKCEKMRSYKEINENEHIR